MLTRSLVAVLLALLVSAAPVHATTCANSIPAGVVVTPSCTWIVQQWDPGVWLDNLGSFWAKIIGMSVPQMLSGHDSRP